VDPEGLVGANSGVWREEYLLPTRGVAWERARSLPRKNVMLLFLWLWVGYTQLCYRTVVSHLEIQHFRDGQIYTVFFLFL